MNLVSNDIINNINILPTVKNNEQPKIINKKIELGYNHANSLNNVNIKNKIEIKKPNLVHSGSQRLILNNQNRRRKNNNLNLNLVSPNKKVLHKNVSSELPSLNIINHLNEIYKIYAPYLKKPQVNNNLKYKPYNGYYLKNIQRYYKIDKPNNNVGKNIYNMNSINNQVKSSNRLGSGRKILPNRKLSPLKRNIINIS